MPLSTCTPSDSPSAAVVDAEADARFASQFVRPMLTIIDACNTREAVNRLNPRQIASFESEASGGSASPVQADLVTAFGILEKFPEPVTLLSRVKALGLPLLCSCRGHGSGERALSVFERLCIEAGFSIAWRYLNRGDAIYLLTPRGHNASDVSPVGYRMPADLVTALKPARPALLVAGFFGRANCGDEALFQVIYEQFSSDFEIIVSLDEHGATDGYWNWYPYDRCQRIHQGNLTDPARSCAGMIVGGGGLPIGFVADQIFVARAAGIPIALAGTDFPSSRSPHHGTRAEIVSYEYLKSFDLIALRSAAAVAQARRVGLHVVHGADWALRLLTDESETIQWAANRVLIVLREFPMSAVSYGYVQGITRLVEELRSAGYAPTLLPFCAEDDRFAAALGLDLIAPSERHWWNARRVKQIIASSGLLISVGRLHPMIFAASTRTAVLQLCPPLADGIDPRTFTKIAAMSDELDVDYLPTVESVCEHLKRGRCRPSGEQALAAAQQRLDDMIGSLRDLFVSATSIDLLRRP